MGHYIIYGGELSLFTRKLEAAMKFYGADFEMQRKTELAGSRAATHQVPVLLTPENWMIADTTPLMVMLDARFPGRRMFQDGPLGVLIHLVEEYLDEWIARVMVHYRWHYPDSAEFASLRMSGGDANAAARVRDWGPRACRATGTESELQQREAEAEYIRILEAAERQLGETRYLLGDRPTAVDCMVLGGLRAHTYMDPDPKKVTSGYPKVVAWCETEADNWDGTGELASFEASTPFARHILGEIATTYQPYVLANRDAQAAGAKAFHAEIYGEDVSYLSRPYPEQSRRMVGARIGALGTGERSAVDNWLREYSLAGCFR